jgi:hypothetical protein
VADEKDGHSASLGERQKPPRHLAHLRDRPRRALDLRREDGLDRIHDHRARLLALHLREDAFEIRLRQQVQILRRHAQTLAAHLDLPLRLLARNVEHARTARAQLVSHFEQQRRFPDAGVAADEDEASRHDAAAEHAVKLRYP